MDNGNRLIIYAQEGPGTGYARYVLLDERNGYAPRFVWPLSLGGGSYRSAIPTTQARGLIRIRLLTPEEIQSFQMEEGVTIHA